MTKLFAAWAGLLAAVAAIESGPQPGEKVGPLKVHAVVGPVQNKEVDYAAERKNLPTVYLFVSAAKFDRPVARFLRELDKQLADVEGAAGVAVWVGGDAEKSKEYLPKLNTSIPFAKTALTVGGDVAGWGINPDAHLTAVVADKGKVVKSFGYASVNETDVKAVVEALKKKD